MFEKFNLINYSLTHDGKKLTDYLLTDITTRAKLYASTEILKTFELNPGETPEDVSNEMYGTPYYHWTIMMVNDIYDINNEWYMTDEVLHKYAVEKYNLNYIVSHSAVNVSTNTIEIIGHKFKPNDVVTLLSDDMPGGLYENTEYYVFQTTDNGIQLTQTPPPANSQSVSQSAIDITSLGTEPITINCNKLDLPAYWIDDQDNIVASALDLYEGWSNNEDTLITFRTKITDIINNQPSRRSYVSGQNKSIVDVDVDVIDIIEEVTPLDQLHTPGYRVLTNFQYEEMLNNKKRIIYTIRPEYIKTFVDKFDEAVSA